MDKSDYFPRFDRFADNESIAGLPNSMPIGLIGSGNLSKTVTEGILSCDSMPLGQDGSRSFYENSPLSQSFKGSDLPPAGVVSTESIMHNSSSVRSHNLCHKALDGMPLGHEGCSLSQSLQGSDMPPEGVDCSESLVHNWSCASAHDLPYKSLESMTESDFHSLDSSLKHKLAYFLGVSAYQDLKCVAKNLTSKDSRSIENIVMSDEFILNNIVICEILHLFFEGITQKFPRSNDEHYKFAGLHVQACESLIKCVNSKAIGIGSLKKNMQVQLKTSKSTLDPGGTRKIIKNLPLGEEIPLREGSGLLVGDNAQRGIGKIQKHSRLKWKRSEACVSVQTHLVVYENQEDKESTLFKREDIGPSSTDFHPLFRPVSDDFLRIIKLRLKKDEDLGYKIISSIFSTYLIEVIDDVKAGKGTSSISKLNRFYDTNCGMDPKVCVKCHVIQDYKPDSQNICAQCSNNPTVYAGSDNDLNPYLRFGLNHGSFKSVKSFEQEPMDLNPSSFQSLDDMMKNISTQQRKKGDKVSVIGLDGLPGIRIKRIQSDMVECTYHNKTFKLCDVKEIREHCGNDCIITWPHPDKIVMLGESHEEIFLNLRASVAASHFGLNEVLEELGKRSKLNKEAAIRRRELNKLFPMNLIFIEGALKMLMSCYVESNWTRFDSVSVQGSVMHCLQNSNSLVSSLFLSVYHFMMPSLVKRLGLRLHRPDIADAASALGNGKMSNLQKLIPVNN